MFDINRSYVVDGDRVSYHVFRNMHQIHELNLLNRTKTLSFECSDVTLIRNNVIIQPTADSPPQNLTMVNGISLSSGFHKHLANLLEHIRAAVSQHLGHDTDLEETIYQAAEELNGIYVSNSLYNLREVQHLQDYKRSSSAIYSLLLNFYFKVKFGGLLNFLEWKSFGLKEEITMIVCRTASLLYVINEEAKQLGVNTLLLGNAVIFNSEEDMNLVTLTSTVNAKEKEFLHKRVNKQLIDFLYERI